MNDERLQWTLVVEVWHGPRFGHSVEMRTQTNGRAALTHESIGSWKGVGIPQEVLTGIRAMVDAALTEHLETRYGVSVGLFGDWGSEPGPF